MVKLTLAVEEVREAAGAVKGVAQELIKAISNGDEVSLFHQTVYDNCSKKLSNLTAKKSCALLATQSSFLELLS